MKYIDTVKRSGRSLRQAKIRTVLTAGAIAVGAFTLTLTLAASNGVQQYANKLVTDNFDPAELVVAADPAILDQSTTSKPQAYDPSYVSDSSRAGIATNVKDLTDGDVHKIAATAGVVQTRLGVSPSIQYITRPASGTVNYGKYEASVSAFSPAQKPDLEAGKIPDSLGDDQILLPADYVSLLGFKNDQAAIGKPVTLAVQKTFDIGAVEQSLAAGTSLKSLATGAQTTNSQLTDFTVAAVTKKPLASQPGTEDEAYITEAAAIKLNDFVTVNTPNYHKYTYIYARVGDGTNQTKLLRVETKLKAEGYAVMSVKDSEQLLNQVINVLRGIVVAFGLIAIVASIFGVVNTMYISVLQRTREIGLMKALGMRRQDIGRLFRFEAALIGLFGGLLGAGLAIALAAALNPTITKKLNLGSGNSLLIFKPMEVVGLIVLLVIIAVFAGLLPARKAAKLDPIEALRTE